MERRGFLKTLVGGITSAGLLLKASPAEVQTFGAQVDEPVILSPQRIQSRADLVTSSEIGELLYDAKGLPVAYITGVHLHRAGFEVTSAQDAYRTHIPGLLDNGELTATILPEAFGRMLTRAVEAPVSFEGVWR